MIMPVHAATLRAAAELHGLARHLPGAPHRPSAIAAKAPHRRPVRHGGWRRFVQRCEVALRIDHAPADDGQIGGHIGDFMRPRRQNNLDLERSDRRNGRAEYGLFLPPRLEPGTFSVHMRNAVSRSRQLRCGVDAQAADRLAGDEPGKRDPGVIGSHTRRIRPGRGFDALSP